jgi:4-hydroxyphenylpyruvate dioxygenase-like putative hemolysin
VIRHDAALATQHGAALRQFFAGARPRLTDAAWQAWTQEFRPDRAGQPAPEHRTQPLTISHLDHLVLTVADKDQTAAFYQRVLDMRPVTFGAGRRALEFGASKNLIEIASYPAGPDTGQGR